MAGDQQEVRQGVVKLITNVKEMANSINSDRHSSRLIQGSLGTTQARVEQLAQMVTAIEALMETTKTACEARVGGLEQACRITAQSLADQLTAQIKDFSVTLKSFKDTQQQHHKRLMQLEKTAPDGPAGHALARAIQIRMQALLRRVEQLEA